MAQEEEKEMDKARLIVVSLAVLLVPLLLAGCFSARPF